MRLVLAFDFSAERLAALRLAALVAKAQVKEVPPEDFHTPLGTLAKIKGFVAKGEAKEAELAEEELPQKEFVYLAGFDRPGLDRFLAAVQRGKLHRIDLKAMATPVNVQWTPLRLFKELRDEHSYMGKMNKKLLTVHSQPKEEEQ